MHPLSLLRRRSRVHADLKRQMELDQWLDLTAENASNFVHRIGDKEKRQSPQDLKAIQASMSESVARAVASASAARAAAASSSIRQGANAATIGTTIARLDQTQAVGAAPTIVQTSRVITTSSTTTSSSSRTTSTSTAPSSTRTTSTSTTSSTSSLTPSTTTTNIILTITSDRPTSSSSSATLPSASLAPAADETDSKALGTGAIVGIAVAVIVGVVLLGSIAGWIYRKFANRSYSSKSPWSKLDDNEVTPFPPSNEKPFQPSDDDIYGNSMAPVIGSRRALAIARDNAFNGDSRPNSEYMIQREGNRAGLGAGTTQPQYDAYPAPVPAAAYGMDAQGRPYNPHGGRVPVNHGYDGRYGPTVHALTSPAESPYPPQPINQSRQLLGPGHKQPFPQQYFDNGLTPVAMGRPTAPTSNNGIADLEEFADLPDTAVSSRNNNSTYSTYGLAYADSEPEYSPKTATTMAEWQGDARIQGNAPPLPIKAPISPVNMPTPLPTLVPVSPLMSSFGGLERRISSQPPLGPLAASFANKYGGPSQDSKVDPMYADEDEHSRQKRMYGEISRAAGFPEPVTPHSAKTDLNASTSSTSSTSETTSSFSAHGNGREQAPSYATVQRLPPMPTMNVTPPQPYQHGRPLSPLQEVATPASTVSALPLTSSSLNHGQNEINPFELLTRGQHPTNLTPASRKMSGTVSIASSGLIPPQPYSAASTTGATSFPSPSFPPPSPGGMSVPGSISDSPRNVAGQRRMSFDEEDAYGGI